MSMLAPLKTSTKLTLTTSIPTAFPTFTSWRTHILITSFKNAHSKTQKQIMDTCNNQNHKM